MGRSVGPVRHRVIGPIYDNGALETCLRLERGNGPVNFIQPVSGGGRPALCTTSERGIEQAQRKCAVEAGTHISALPGFVEAVS
jgi:hypothetical protein